MSSTRPRTAPRSRPGWAVRLAVGVLTVMLCTAAQVALAHGGEHHPELPWWKKWTLDPLLLFNLTMLAGLYAAGLWRLWRKAGIGHTVSRSQAAAYALAMVALVVALVSPLDVLSDELSSAHMVQHMVLMMVSAPLFVMGAPAHIVLWALPHGWRQRMGRLRSRVERWPSTWYLLWQPLAMWSLYAFTLWIWHLPVFYHAALRHPLVHDFQHLSFFVASCLFWRIMLDPLARLRLNRGLAVLYLFTTSLHATVLGVFMALAPRPWYSDYEGRTVAWNLTTLEDQQLAGFIMWMPACMIYAVVAAVLFAFWLHELEASNHSI